MERDYTDRQMTVLTQMRDRMLANRKKGEDPEEVMAVFRWLKELYYSNIPQVYWTLELRKLKLEETVLHTLNLYTEHLDNALARGLGIGLIGPTGTGKTSALCEVGKSAILDGHSVVYITLENYINIFRERETNPEASLLYWKVWNSDFILLDELDKVYIKDGSTWVVKLFTDLIKGTTPFGKSMLIASNMDEAELRSLFGDAVYSALQRHLTFVVVNGEDYSKKLELSWSERLKDTMEVEVTKYLKEMASLMDRKKQERNRKLFDECWEDDTKKKGE